MHKFGHVLLMLSIVAGLATACSLQMYSGAAPTLTALPTSTFAPLTIVPPSPTTGSPTAAAAASQTPATSPTLALSATPTNSVLGIQATETQAAATSFCSDPQTAGLIDTFKSALQSSNGALLASLVSPDHGMDTRLYRNGRVVNYDPQHAKFLFDTTYVVDWGPAPGSGLETTGSFHDVIVPELLDVFNRNYTLNCNHLQVGGTSYQAIWPYPGINFYSVFYPGSQGNGSLDWHTWVLGMDYVGTKPYLYAIMPFKWEP